MYVWDFLLKYSSVSGFRVEGLEISGENSRGSSKVPKIIFRIVSCGTDGTQARKSFTWMLGLATLQRCCCLLLAR